MSDAPPRLDLNCDLAEGEPAERTAALMAEVTSANIACGGHAGNEHSMRHAVRLALQGGVRLGAHPGLPGHFGRRPVIGLSQAEFLELLHVQVARLGAIAAAEGGRLHHVKLHGALYHATERQPALRDALVDFMTATCPGTVVYALAAGRTVAAARAAGLTAWDEAFADRGYRTDGSLVPRDQPQALLLDPGAISARVTALALGRPIATTDGPPLHLPTSTLCMHGDAPNSITLLRAARAALQAASART